MTVQEAVAYELRGMDVIRKAGLWRLIRTTTGKYALVQALTHRDNGETYIKLIDSSMGPSDSPPKAMFNEWLRLSKGQERTKYEIEFIERVRNEFIDRAAIKPLKAGDTFSFATPIKWSDGVEEGTFVYIERFRARRKCDDRLIRLPKNFRKRIVAETPV